MSRVAIIHEATLVPSKLDLLDGWLASQPWAQADEGLGHLPITRLGTYRFDDPEGEVGIEGFLLRRGEALFHVVLTYRGAPLAGAGSSLVGTMEHSVLGRRWVYDGLGDPVAVAALTRAVRGQQNQAVLELHSDGDVVGRRESDVGLRISHGDAFGSSPEPVVPHGAVEEVTAGGDRLRVARSLGGHVTGRQALVAEWPGGEAVIAAFA